MTSAIQTRRTASASVSRALARGALRHPEWWSLLIASAAWVALFSWHAFPAVVGADHDHANHVAGTVSTATETTLQSVVVDACLWFLMVVAMMTVVMVPRMRRVAAACTGRHRVSAIATTLAGAGAVWAAIGVVAVGLGAVLPPLDSISSPSAFIGLWVAAAVWQLMSAKQVSLRRCHQVRLQRGRRDGMQFRPGATYGMWCAVSCGPAMLAMALTGHPLGLMVLLTAGFTAERLAFRPARAARLLTVAIIVVAVVELVRRAIFG